MFQNGIAFCVVYFVIFAKNCYFAEGQSICLPRVLFLPTVPDLKSHTGKTSRPKNNIDQAAQ
jgi:hypothetical protein